MNKLGKVSAVESLNKGIIYQGSVSNNKKNVGNVSLTVPASLKLNDLMIVGLMTKNTTLATYSPTWSTAMYVSAWNSGTGKIRVLYKKALANEPKSYTFTCNAAIMVVLRYVDTFASASTSVASGQGTLITSKIPGTFYLSLFGSLYTTSIALTTTGETSDLLIVNSTAANIGLGASLHVNDLTIARSTTLDTMVNCVLGLV